MPMDVHAMKMAECIVNFVEIPNFHQICLNEPIATPNAIDGASQFGHTHIRPNFKASKTTLALFIICMQNNFKKLISTHVPLFSSFSHCFPANPRGHRHLLQSSGS
jgi:hypothetical protein